MILPQEAQHIFYVIQLERVQRKVLKLICYRLDGIYTEIDFPYDDLLSRFNVVELSRRRELQAILFLFNTLNGLTVSQVILNRSLSYIYTPIRVTRGARVFYPATLRTDCLKFSPVHSMLELYNAYYDGLDIFNCSISQNEKLVLLA